MGCVRAGERVAPLAAAAPWEQARRALRFASSTWQGRRVIAFDRLELLAALPVQRLLGTTDMLCINGFAATEAGALAVDTLEAFCVFGSLRRPAAQLGFPVDDPDADYLIVFRQLLLWPIDEQG